MCSEYRKPIRVDSPVKGAGLYSIKVITTVDNIYIDDLTNYKTTAKSRGEMRTWTKTTEVRLERNTDARVTEELGAMELDKCSCKGWQRKRHQQELPIGLGDWMPLLAINHTEGGGGWREDEGFSTGHAESRCLCDKSMSGQGEISAYCGILCRGVRANHFFFFL